MAVLSVGQSLPRVDLAAKVTGKAEYVFNMELPGMLYGKAVRSLVPHGEIRAIHAEEARQLPGVVAVATGADLDGLYPWFGPVIHDQCPLAIGRVRYVGDVIAAVVAESEAVAEKAAELVQVECEELPAVLDAYHAMQPGAPLLHPELRLPDTGFTDVRAVLHPEPGTNIVNYFRLRRGDVTKGFAQADHVFEDTFRFPNIQHCPLEPHASIARFEGNGVLRVWSSSQTPYNVQVALAQMFHLPQSRVRVDVPYLGGGFGSKTYPKLEPLAAVLAWKTRRPVKVALTREEEFITVNRHAVTVQIKTGVRRDGSFTAREVRLVWDTGAYADIGPRLVKNAGYASVGPYRIPNVKVDSYCVYTNKPPAVAFRGYGVPKVAVAHEVQMDRIARKLGLDPLRYRLREVVGEGDTFATGETLHSVGYQELLRKCAQEIGWGSKPAPSRAGKVPGKGLSVSIKSTITPSASQAEVRIYEDGSAAVLTSTVEMGQGSDTALAQIAAQALEIDPGRVQVIHPDTAATPYDMTTSSSRSTFHMGNAINLAAEDAKQQLRDAAAAMLRATPADLVYEGGEFFVPSQRERCVSLAEAARGTGTGRGGVTGRGLFRTDGGLDDSGQGKASVFWFAAAGAAEVEVDTETGQVHVVKFVGGVDVGKAINPQSCRQQNEGSIITGLGATLNEELVYDNGQAVNPSFLEYKLPTFLDLPDVLQTVEVETAHREGPYGAKGMGEAAVAAVAPAVLNAIRDAVGAELRDLPVTPEKVLAACAREEGNAGHDRDHNTCQRS